jgi:hypothetical protein
MIRAWHYQGPMLCIPLAGPGLTKYRWFAGLSFRLRACMTSKYTVYDIAIPFLTLLPFSRFIN